MYLYSLQWNVDSIFFYIESNIEKITKIHCLNLKNMQNVCVVFYNFIFIYAIFWVWLE